MNRIVRERYPVSKLPEDLRREFEGQEFVDIVSTRTDGADQAASKRGNASELESGDTNLGAQFSQFKRGRRSNYKSIEEVNDYVNALRDEWAHRER